VSAEVVLAEAREEHVPIIAARMRPADRDEVLASAGFDPETAIREALKISEFARTAYIHGEPAAIFGVVRDDECPWAVPWLLTTDVVETYPLTFWKASKSVLHTLRKAYPDLLQFVDARHEQAMRWAKRLGFHVEQPIPWGLAGLPFCQIRIGGIGV
jgi:hypothetical protein